MFGYGVVLYNAVWYGNSEGVIQAFAQPLVEVVISNAFSPRSFCYPRNATLPDYHYGMVIYGTEGCSDNLTRWGLGVVAEYRCSSR